VKLLLNRPSNALKRPILYVALLSSAWLSGCSTYPAWLPSGGPSLEQVTELEEAPAPLGEHSIRVLEVTRELSRKLRLAPSERTFGQVWGQPVSSALGGQGGIGLGAGDVVEVSVWEAPPAALFGTSVVDVRTGAASTSRVVVLPEQMVNHHGAISVPFVGAVQVAGRSTMEVETAIVERLRGKANQPQVLVRVVRNTTSNATVVGEVNLSNRLPLTAKGERVLDAVAAAGGVRQPVGKITLQLTRGDTVVAMPLDSVIRHPQHNVVLQPGDVLTALHQPYSFTVLGATLTNREIDFEAQGITLAQALGRIGGLQDNRADARGLFIFRFEDPALLPGGTADKGEQAPVPVVYQVNLKDPASFFAAQDFPMRSRDVVYVANSPAAELQKFLNIVGSVTSPINVIQNLTTN
jgi:polysaccharide export outer membrane protein